MVLALRRKVNIKVRQPLARMIIPILDPHIQEQFEKVRTLVLNEVNVKNVEYIEDTTGLITKKIKPNFKTLGKKYGKLMKEISSVFRTISQKEIAAIETAGINGENYNLALSSTEVALEPNDYEVISEDMPGWLVATEGKLTIALDISVTEELKNEGIARELINRIQNLRKDSGFEVTDKIYVVIENKEGVTEAIKNFGDYVASQTLALDIKISDNVEGGSEVEWTDGDNIKIHVSRK